MPVILASHDEVHPWLRAPAVEALTLQRPLPVGALTIVARGQRQDAAAAWKRLDVGKGRPLVLLMEDGVEPVLNGDREPAPGLAQSGGGEGDRVDTAIAADTATQAFSRANLRLRSFNMNMLTAHLASADLLVSTTLLSSR